ncbi:uncharacterized protein BT62DRAFT_929364 [Guyanagaster necrorhizus]|uniref:Fungal-type protein kinase domain-containing protein n=1 Tax=Guyanagaster necrorhizus TaxID=856835 RepID=A0A9P7VY86_9AGAR|nr:uncharacterized protein BT62DRAFT_929364 [Guyanagaster necrorhizus MCA 3950]KAG7449398.1 hypothetical protein BT62DRAFT_929364 [Guyanagaster necrorhizus MCA 3950]
MNPACEITDKLLENIQETPQHCRRTENLSHASNTMEEHRADVVKDIKAVPRVSLEYYERYILPHTAYRDYVGDIVDVLKADGILKAFGGESGLRWADFPNDPKDSCVTENECFKYMATISAAIVKAAQKVLPGDRQPTTVMECEPHKPAASEGHNGLFVADGHYRLLQSKSPKYVQNMRSSTVMDTPALTSPKTEKLACDHPALEEYKQDNQTKDQNDNIAKLIGNTSQTMYADPTRRFMFGTTIENTTTRFWFFSRAIILVTKSFNFIKDYAHLIHYVLSLSFAMEEELGYDLSITRVAYFPHENPSAHTIQYDYSIGSNTYRTIKCLSSFRASGLLSRATRVWKVFQLNDPQYRECVLKDVWVPSDAKTELEIQQDIFRGIEENNPGISKDYQKHFMEILQCEVVQTSQKRDDDMPLFVRTSLETIGEFALHRQEMASPSRTILGTNISVPMGAGLGNPNADSNLKLPHLHKGRKHVRVIFADVGVPLSEVWQLHILFNALGDALKGLYYLYKGYYVHRDISAGNIILCNGMGKISDLEYVKRFLSHGLQNDPKTGTPIYMSVEVQETRYLFARTKHLLPEFGGPVSEQDMAPFLHNYLHDIESLFWIGFHSLFSTTPAIYTKKELAQRDRQRQLFNAFFPHCLEGGFDRRHLFQFAEFQDTKEALPAEYRPSIKWLIHIRFILAYHYDKVENLPDFPRHEHFNKVYSTEQRNSNLFLAFEAAAEAAYSGGIQLLLPDEADKPISINQPQGVLVFGENSAEGDRDDDQMYVDDSLEHSGHQNDREPPYKMQRKSGRAKQRKLNGYAQSIEQESPEGIHSTGKRKRSLRLHGVSVT